MNRLVKALIAQPLNAEVARRADRLPFGLLREALGASLFSGAEWEAISGNERVIRDLRTGYLPVVNSSDWTAALRLADEADVNGGSNWWTVMIPLSHDIGLTVPQDSSDADLIALFSGSLSSAQTIAYNLAQVQSAIVPVAHCSPPSWGICAPGSCGGCKACLVWDPVTKTKGITCRCPDRGQ